MGHRAQQLGRRSTPWARSARRGFTVAEAAMASAVLGLIMLAVATAIATAQQMAFESQKRLLASIAADDMLVEVSTLPYDDLAALNGRTDAVGELKTLDGDFYPDSFWPLGRRIEVRPARVTDEDSGAAVNGRMVTVACFDGFADIAVYELWVAEGGGDG